MLKEVRDFVFGTLASFLKELEEYKKPTLFEEMVTVFETLDQNKLVWVIKNIDNLTYDEFTKLVVIAHMELQATPNFSTQAYWYSVLFNSRNAMLQASLLSTMIFESEGRFKNSSKLVTKNSLMVDTEYVVDKYSISFNYFLDLDGSGGDPSLPLWVFFTNGIFDDVINPYFCWKELKRQTGIQSIKDAMLNAPNMKDIYFNIFFFLKGRLNKSDMDEFIETMRINAMKNGWETEIAELEKTTANKVIPLH